MIERLTPTEERVIRVTARQREAIERLQEPGATQASVAEAMGISTQTLKNALQLAYRTLGVHSLEQAARALRDRIA